MPAILSRTAALIAMLLPLCAGLAADVQRDFSVVLVGNSAGTMTLRQASDEAVTIAWEFNDRGRGPDVTAAWTLDEAGRPAALTISGVDYMKAGVEESLETVDGILCWTSAADSGRSAEPGFYVSLDGPPGELWLLARALIGDEDQVLPLLPDGEARLERVGTHTFDGGLELEQVEIHGLGFEPQTVWLDEQGELFAVISGWLGVIRESHESRVPALNEIQDERRRHRFRALAERSRTIPRQQVLIDNARIFDVASGTVARANAVVVEGATISAVLQPGDARPDGATTVDARGRTLLPGLWDMHTHLGLADGPLHLAAGVTTVRDLANDHDQLMSFIEAVDNGDMVGPHVLRAGFIDGTGPFAGPTKARVETLAEAKRWIDFYAVHGYRQIKIYSSIPVELVPDMAAYAHERGLRFSGHIPAGMWADQAVRAGFDEIQHVNMLFLSFYRDVVETRNTDRFIKVGERGADLVIDSAPFRELTRLLLDNDTVVDPTVAVFMDLFVHEPGRLAPSLRSAEGRLPPQVARANLKGGLAVPAGWEQRYRASAAKMLEVIGALHDAGVPLVAGTDGMAGFTLHAELGYYQQAGIPAPEILRLATLGSAEIMGLAGRVGRIAPGQRADLILVPGEPDRDIAAMEKVDWVMKNGEMVDPAELYRALSVQPASRQDALAPPRARLNAPSPRRS